MNKQTTTGLEIMYFNISTTVLVPVASVEASVSAFNGVVSSVIS
jgi:hypothetical protein